MIRTFAKPITKSIGLVLSLASLGPLCWAQDQNIVPIKSTGPILVRPYKEAAIPPAPLSNSDRLHSLVRAGKLYLTVQDTIALALENNIDLEIERYNPLVDTWNLERYQGGGALPGVPSGQSLSSSVASGQGVAGSQAAAGVSTTASSQGAGNPNGATISQIGPVTPTFDPSFQYSAAFSHRSVLQFDEVQTGLYNVIDNIRSYSATLSQGLPTGGQITINYKESYLNENVPSDTPNPTYAPSISISFQHALLQGRGVALNSRFITTAKATLKADDYTFNSNVIGVVANALTLYYGLAADYEDLKAKQSALNVAQQFFENNKKEVQLGAMAPLDVTTAEAQVASSQQDLVVSQTNLEQQQVQLKNVLSRNGLADPIMTNAEIIPLDHIEIPEHDDLPPIRTLVATALKNRPDLAVARINLSSTEITNLGTQNGVLPQAEALMSASSQGLAGPYRIGTISNAIPVAKSSSGSSTASGSSSNTSSVLPLGATTCPSTYPPGTLCIVPLGNFVGGISNGLSQTFSRDFPSERAGGYIYAPFRNREAQADNRIDQLSLRQQQLQYQQSLNQLAVDVSNGVVGMQQARVRYLAAVKSRELEQQLLEAEQKKFSLGASTTFLVVQQQRDLATAQSAEIAALVTYSNARVAFDQTLGTTLENTHVSIEEAAKGRVLRVSSLPATLPEEPTGAVRR